MKKVVFPLECLPWVPLGAALFHAAASLLVLLIANVVFRASLPWTIALLPFVLAPVVLLSMGLAWLLASLGVYVRDVGQAVGVLTTVLLFLSPVFYPGTALPESLRGILLLNPLAIVIEQTRTVLIGGEPPSWAALAWCYVPSRCRSRASGCCGSIARGRGLPMSSELAVRVDGLGKCYQIYDRPEDRLKQILWRGRRRFYREFWALRDVSFELPRGGTLGIVGRNGSGKSTLLQLIAGTLTPTTGRRRCARAAWRRCSSSAPASIRSSPAARTCFSTPPSSACRKPQIEARFDDIARFADIGEFIDQPVKLYSSGMFVRLAFAVATAVDPDILILDEALSVGDARFQLSLPRTHHAHAGGRDDVDLRQPRRQRRETALRARRWCSRRGAWCSMARPTTR